MIPDGTKSTALFSLVFVHVILRRKSPFFNRISIEETKCLPPPSWLCPDISVNTALINFIRKDELLQGMKAIALDFLFERQFGYTKIYTDGSETSNETFAVTIPTSHPYSSHSFSIFRASPLHTPSFRRSRSQSCVRCNGCLNKGQGDSVI